MTSIGKGAIGAIAISWLAIGCNQSNAELDSTKQQLQQVSAERDSLKTQLDAANQQNAAAQQQIAQLKSAPAATVEHSTEAATAQNEKLSHPPKEHAAAAPEAKKQEIKAKHRAM
jgi:outer membrane murein-binding lipoprotein Lpp